jgi:predicted signal transduction protein with EAL and GGDEF domain
MFKLARYIRGRALTFTIIGILCIVIAAFFDAMQPTFLNNAINSITHVTPPPVIKSDPI